MKTWQPDFPTPSSDAHGRLVLTASEPEPGYVKEGDLILWQGAGWKILSIQRPTEGKAMMTVEREHVVATGSAPGVPTKALAGVAKMVAGATEFLQALRDIQQLQKRVGALEEGQQRILNATPAARPRRS